MPKRRTKAVQAKRAQLAQGVKRIRREVRAGNCEGAFWTLRTLEHEGLFNHARLSSSRGAGLHTRMKNAVEACKVPWRPWAHERWDAR